MEQKKSVKTKVNMISAVSHALDYRKKNPRADEEEIMKQVSRYVSSVKDKNSKIAMIAAASRALKMVERVNIPDREIIKKVMSELPQITEKID